MIRSPVWIATTHVLALQELLMTSKFIQFLMNWSGRLDSNQRPPRPERGALPTALRPDIQINFRDFLQNWAIYI